MSNRRVEKESHMHTGGQSSGYSHDQSEINIFGIFPASGILNSLYGPVGVFASPFWVLFVFTFGGWMISLWETAPEQLACLLYTSPSPRD